ncbi:interferon-inducible GTPase 5-like [Dicentrarchus labrax]|uniref:interferon-inducible GTPase 5-like n=1 Tax=Dicentrarchus labrax TaxID=13489 RepID=UPI0021F51D07|nr:interferon-inducible GTPase 5-like [Dicentrarchus labrax]
MRELPPTGSVETTMKVAPYPHPNYPNVTLWDLPGVGTTKFPADKYLEHVGFEKFDIFIIISDTRFRENDEKLAFIHRTTSGAVWGSKKHPREPDDFRPVVLTSHIMRTFERLILHVLRPQVHHTQDPLQFGYQEKVGVEDAILYLLHRAYSHLDKESGAESPQVFLVSSFELHLYDFHLLEETLERELPAHKRNALLLAMLNINLEIINKKKEALQAKIKYHASVSALIASAPVAGLSFATDVTILAETIRMYQVTFGLDCESLENLARTARVPLNDLKEVMTSPLAAKEISKDLVIKLLCLSAGEAALMAAEEGSRFIPLIGIPLAMTFSFISTYRALSTFLNMLAEDAHRVFTKALGLNTSL